MQKIMRGAWIEWARRRHELGQPSSACIMAATLRSGVG